LSLDPLLYSEAHDLLEAICREEATAADFARLEEIARDDPEVRGFYLDYLDIHVQLRWSFGERQVEGDDQQPAACRAAQVQAPPRSPVLGFLSGLWSAGSDAPGVTAFSWLVMACVCTGLVLTIFFSIVLVFRGVANNGDAPQVAGQGARSNGLPSPSGRGAGGEGIVIAPTSPIPPSGAPTSAAAVARLIHAVDCHWVIGSHSPHVGDDLEPGRKLALMSGLAEIMFTSGVRVLLEGPATLEIGSEMSTFLSRGKLSVVVEDPSARGFEVRTPGMTYTDLGTEFGVLVAMDGSQEMHVFRGQVRAESDGGETGRRGDTEKGGHGGPSVPASSLVLSSNQAIRVEKPQGNAPIAIVRQAAVPDQFVRKMSPATELDLVDVAAGGDGLSAHRNRAINPSNGEFKDSPHGGDNIDHSFPGIYFKPDRKYHRVPASTLIDGVFVVQGGAGPVQLDSAGHTFAKFPGTTALTSQFIWAVGAGVSRTGMLEDKDDKDYAALAKFGSFDYTSAGHGMLYLRSNKGITFDLRAIRHAHPQYRLLRFAASAGEPAHGEFKGKRGASDFWVFVDGQLRFEKQHAVAQKQEIPIDIALDPASSFLTLATTDGGDHIWGDWCLFADPRLILGPAEKAAGK
jgi:hypothetical protein